MSMYDRSPEAVEFFNKRAEVHEQRHILSMWARKFYECYGYRVETIWLNKLHVTLYTTDDE